MSQGVDFNEGLIMTISIGFLADSVRFSAYSNENKKINPNEDINVEQELLMDSLNRHGFSFTRNGIDICIKLTLLTSIDVLDQIINDACLNPMPKSLDVFFHVVSILGTFKYELQVPRDKKTESKLLKAQGKDDRHLRVDARVLIEEAINISGQTLGK